MMAASDDESCSALHDQDLSDSEWQIVEVSVCDSCIKFGITCDSGVLGRNHCKFSSV